MTAPLNPLQMIVLETRLRISLVHFGPVRRRFFANDNVRVG